MIYVVIGVALFFIALNALFMVRAFAWRSRVKREAKRIDWYALSFGAKSKDAP